MKHLIIDGRGAATHYKFKPSQSMRRAGFRGQSFGPDRAAAEAYVALQNAAHDAARHAKAAPKPSAATIAGLIDRFLVDPIFYTAKAPATQDEIDYAFQRIRAALGPALVRSLKRADCRAYYAELLLEGSPHRARKIMKWLHRLFEFAIELGGLENNPARRLQIQKPPARDAVWLPAEVDAVIAAALAPHRSSQGNIAEARPSVALAIQIAYDTSLPQQDILALTWNQYDGEGLTVRQMKRRGAGRDLWLPLGARSLEMIEATDKTSTHLIVSEQTAQPYPDKNIFGRAFRKIKDRAGVRPGLTFHDLRTTALTEMGNRGSTNAEIISFSGHNITSPVLGGYVLPDREAARRGRAKRDNEEN